MPSITFNYTIPFGSSLRVGYKLQVSSDPYTYISGFPSYNDSPYTLIVPSLGAYQLELTTVCSSCAGGLYSDPVIVLATATS